MVDDKDVLSIRNLIEGGFDTPLKKFKGVLHSYGVEENKPAQLQFTDVEVIESTEPYPYPTATIEIWPSNRKQSKWGVFGTSLAKLISSDEDLKHCIGREIGLALTDGHLLPKKNDETGQWQNVPQSAWEVFSVDGNSASEGQSTGAVSAKTAAEYAMDLLDGKSIAEFNKAAMADNKVRGDEDLMKQIVAKTFASSLVTAGIFTKDDEDIYHRVQ